MPTARTAYVDESLRVRAGLYVLAAVIVADAQADRHREALRALLHRGQQRLHWRDESGCTGAMKTASAGPCWSAPSASCHAPGRW
jgi:hypothetical protein